MFLDGKEFDVSSNKMEDFFGVMDKLKKEILSKDVYKNPVSEDDKKNYCIYEVSGHAIGLPKEAKKDLEKFIDYL